MSIAIPLRSPMNTSSIKVAIIGAGPHGLSALHNFLDEGFNATIFERQSRVGGLWVLNDAPTGAPAAVRSTVLNVSRYRNCFSDFPYDNKLPVYINADQFRQYMQDYADHFDLGKRIRFNTSVEGLRRIDNEAKWELSIKLEDGSNHTEQFDKVIIATGSQTTSIMPTFEGADLFKGGIIHSSSYTKPTDYAGKSVLIAGFGNTAADTAVDLAGHTSKLYVSHRRGCYVLPRYYQGKPMDQIVNRRKQWIGDCINYWAPGWFSKLRTNLVGEVFNNAFPDLDPSWNFYPSPRLTSNRIIISEGFVHTLRTGAVKSVPRIARITGPRSVELTDESTVDVDVILCCTGYAPNATFFKSLDVEFDDYYGKPQPRLYQNIFPPAHADSIAYLDAWQLPTGICEAADLCTMALAQLWKGAVAFPPRAEMEAHITRHVDWLRDHVGDEPEAARLTVREAEWRWWLHKAAGTGVDQYCGLTAKTLWLWWTDRSFYNKLMNSVDSPHLYRLFDGRRRKWDGAKKAIEDVWADFERRFGKDRVKGGDFSGEKNGESR